MCPLPLLLSLGTTGKSLVPFYLHPPFRYLYTLRSPLNLLQAELSQLSQSFHIRNAVVRLSSLCSFTGLCPVCPYLSNSGDLTTGHNTSAVTSPVLSRGEGSTPLACWHSPNAAQDTTGLLRGKGTLLGYGKLMLIRTPRAFLPSCFPIGWLQAYAGPQGCSFTNCRMLLI